MSLLSRALYLAWNKPRLSKEFTFQSHLGKAKTMLIRLAEQPPYTVFSLWTAGSLDITRKGLAITVISPADAGLLCQGFNFEELLDVPSSPRHGSKAFKLLKEKLGNKSFDVFCDLDPSPLCELAVLSGARLRIAYRQPNLFPFFNLMLDPPLDSDLRVRAELASGYLACRADVRKELPTPHTTQKSANKWLRKKGLGTVKKTSYLLSSIDLGTDNLNGIEIIPPAGWKGAGDKTKASLFASASAYIGRPDRGFELAYLLEVPSLLLLDPKQQTPPLPASPLLKTVVVKKGQVLGKDYIKKILFQLDL